MKRSRSPNRATPSQRHEGGDVQPSSGNGRSADTQRLLHELSVHQIELETQNDEMLRAREEMEAALARYTELFDFAPIGYLTVGPDGKILEANHIAARFFGRPRAKLIGSTVDEFLMIPDRQVYSALVGRAMDSSEREEAEVALFSNGGRPACLRLTATMLARGGGKLLLGAEDITSRRERDAKLEHTEQALRETDRRRNDFLSVLSHELRNPLAPIRNALYVLTRAEAESAASERAQAIIDRQVTHLARLVDDLLDVTRISRGKVHLQRERVELGELVRRTIDDHRSSFDAADIRLECTFESAPFWLDADPARLVQSLSNVLGNALKFTPAGGLVSVRLERAGDRVILTVQDSGVGISSDTLAHLFEPFAQGPQTLDRSRGGLGLGLAMVKGLIELHGGTVTVQSSGPDSGTTLRMALPLGSVAAAKNAVETEQEAAGPIRRVLVIEDNVDAADTLKDALSFDGHQVVVAYDGIGGLARARSFRPDVVICDIGLPVMDGYAVARAFRSASAVPYLIALSGYAQPEDVARALEAGFDRHVAKPPSLDTLHRLVAEAPVRSLDEGSPAVTH